MSLPKRKFPGDPGHPDTVVIPEEKVEPKVETKVEPEKVKKPKKRKSRFGG